MEPVKGPGLGDRKGQFLDVPSPRAGPHGDMGGPESLEFHRLQFLPRDDPRPFRFRGFCRSRNRDGLFQDDLLRYFEKLTDGPRRLGLPWDTLQGPGRDGLSSPPLSRLL